MNKFQNYRYNKEQDGSIHIKEWYVPRDADPAKDGRWVHHADVYGMTEGEVIEYLEERESV